MDQNDPNSQEGGVKKQQPKMTAQEEIDNLDKLIKEKKKIDSAARYIWVRPFIMLTVATVLVVIAVTSEKGMKTVKNFYARTLQSEAQTVIQAASKPFSEARMDVSRTEQFVALKTQESIAQQKCHSYFGSKANGEACESVRVMNEEGDIVSTYVHAQCRSGNCQDGTCRSASTPKVSREDFNRIILPWTPNAYRNRAEHNNERLKVCPSIATRFEIEKGELMPPREKEVVQVDNGLKMFFLWSFYLGLIFFGGMFLRLMGYARFFMRWMFLVSILTIVFYFTVVPELNSLPELIPIILSGIYIVFSLLMFMAFRSGKAKDVAERQATEHALQRRPAEHLREIQNFDRNQLRDSIDRWL